MICVFDMVGWRNRIRSICAAPAKAQYTRPSVVATHFNMTGLSHCPFGAQAANRRREISERKAGREAASLTPSMFRVDFPIGKHTFLSASRAPQRTTSRYTYRKAAPKECDLGQTLLTRQGLISAGGRPRQSGPSRQPKTGTPPFRRRGRRAPCRCRNTYFPRASGEPADKA